ncbi:hypothetical protein FOA43_004364 [Brettanomyces nanus]|uniref:GP-PDE domain-containing protein n=1 Tax=Eeniella nana TaxID=13502 RepID=A0A875RQH4_EENNA|nr:uncharacterized protein FOA43_004364 [Brettanomyces nanus]QPG76970.1 hypothetical protein FOA43_004364 [Brettanomyces nanus]
MSRASPVLAGHRGFKYAWPENTIRSYDAAVDAGCDVVETDLHISKDNIIVICHDSDTTRVFGKRYDVTQEKYTETLSVLRTIREPHLPMPTLTEVFQWCKEKCAKTHRNIKLMLDIKRDCDPDLLLKLLLADLTEVGPNIEYWYDKLIFGMWDSRYYCKEMDPFQIINITFDVNVSKQVVQEIIAKGGHVFAVSILSLILYNGSLSRQFYDFCNENHLKIWFWTINLKKEADDAVKFCTLPSGKSMLAGLVTDDPLSVAAEKEESLGLKYHILLFLKKNLYLLFLFLLHRKFNMLPIFKLLKSIGFI